MPIGFDYRCTQCGHEWLLFSTRFEVGPVQWGATKWTCFHCQTFLSIASSVDRSSWSKWYAINAVEVNRVPVLETIASEIESRIAGRRGLAQMTLQFDQITCPTCSDPMSTIPFGKHPMKCEKCGEFSGESVKSCTITTYALLDPDENPPS